MDKLDSARNALGRLEAILEDGPGEKTRDAAILRFECAAEIRWKALQEMLKRDYAEEVCYPEGCCERAVPLGLIGEDLCLALNPTVLEPESNVSYLPRSGRDAYFPTPAGSCQGVAGAA